MPLYARENVLEMYNAYHALGGNGAITKLMEEMENLPTHQIE
jgi:Zn/Cd-binding protein ZinT